jgi:VWFA-related protein
VASVRLRGDFRLFILCCFAFVCSHLLAQDSTYTFKSNVNVVLVPVLVRDKQGKEIGSLKKEDFQVFDNGKPQIISGLTIQKRAGSESAATPAPPTAVAPTLHQPPIPERFIVFLFDDMHLSLGDLAQAQKAGTKILSASLTETDMAAVVSLSGKINSGLTTDRAPLQDAIMKLQPQNLYRSTGSECPPMDYYHADLIENKHNSNALEAAIQEVMSCSPGIQLRDTAQRLAETAARKNRDCGDL